ncbi:hypothetical protein [Butyrivibrio fibrisolvens]|uniref:hypothetical protein n=1 Tax=Butyrivibrio fibrisolvens TaxID=831 RepID=UPI0003B4229F|nr:hypothetical protein [Butyrivibrio fibrisolvens]
MNKPKLGKITENDWKESASINIAIEAFEANKKIKTYFAKQDKRPNFDGSLSIIEKNEEIITVEVQIKTLPSDYSYKKITDYQYRYSCDIKIFSAVIRRTTLNPVALVLVDKNKRIVFVKLITKGYIKSLGIGNQVSKLIRFSDDDILDVDKFIDDVKKYRKLQFDKKISAETPVVVDVEAINRELRRRKRHYNKIEHDDYSLVYIRNNIRCYLSNFLHDREKPYHVIMLKISDGLVKEKTFKPVYSEYNECMEDEWIQITSQKILSLLIDLFCEQLPMMLM